MTITLSEIVSKVHARNIQQKHVSSEALFNVNIGGLVKQADRLGHEVGKNLPKAVSETSLSQITQVANLEPRLLLEDTLRTLPNLDKFMLTLTNMYAAYYLQAVTLTATVNGVSVLSRLDKFNPNRDVDLQPIISAISREGYMDNVFKLPDYKKASVEDLSVVKPSKAAVAMSQEAIHTVHRETHGHDANGPIDAVERTTYRTQGQLPENQTAAKPAEIKQGLKQIADLDNLAVGRMLEVNLIIDGQQFQVPTAVRIRPMSVPQPIMRELVALGDIRESWLERWHRWRAGELTLIGDIVLQNDIIRNRRKLMALDKQGLYRELLARRRNNKIAAITSGQPSLGTISSFMVISTQTAKQIEYRNGMPIENEEFRSRIFSQNSAMMILVVDTEWETIKGYTHGVRGVAEYSFKQFEGMSKGNGPDIAEIMKAYTLGNNPRF